MPETTHTKAAQTYHHGDLKAALRAEAERILVERGVADIGLREIARGIGVSHNAPYRHYPNREALLADIAAGGFQRLGALYLKDKTLPDPIDRIIAIGHSYLRFAKTEPAVFQLMLGKDLAKPQYADLKAAAGAAFSALQTELLAFGVPAPAVSETLALWSMVHGMAVLALNDRIDEHGGVIDLAQIVTTFTTTFLAGAKAQSEMHPQAAASVAPVPAE